MTYETPGRPSTPSLFADALSQMTVLFETEIRLVRTEVSEKISYAIKAVVALLVAVGGIGALGLFWQAAIALGAPASLSLGGPALLACFAVTLRVLGPHRAPRPAVRAW